MLDASLVDRYLARAGGAGICLYITLLTVTYGGIIPIPKENWVPLEGLEREVPLIAAIVLMVILLFYYSSIFLITSVTKENKTHHSIRQNIVTASSPLSELTTTRTCCGDDEEYSDNDSVSDITKETECSQSATSSSSQGSISSANSSSQSQLDPALVAQQEQHSSPLLPKDSVNNTNEDGTPPISGVLWAALATICIAIVTNLQLAFLPTPVMVDPVTGVRYFMLRWLEWIPLSGLMTFMSEAIDLSEQDIQGRNKKGTKENKTSVPNPWIYAVGDALAQLISTSCGLVFPFCTSLVAWWIVNIISFLTYFTIFKRVQTKYKLLQEEPTGGATIMEQENYNRRYYAYHLLKTCSFVWTTLVTMWTMNICIHVFLPVGHPYRNESFSMVFDTMFDVIAKGLYLGIVVELHKKVFDSNARIQRQFQELQKLIKVLWDTTNDVIIISVRGQEKTSSIFSPSYQAFIGMEEAEEQDATSTNNNNNSGGTSSWTNQAPSDQKQQHQDKDEPSFSKYGYVLDGFDTTNVPGILLHTSSQPQKQRPQLLQPQDPVQVLDARFIDSRHISPPEGDHVIEKILPIPLEAPQVQLATNLIQSCWNHLNEQNLKHKREQQQEQEQKTMLSSSGKSFKKKKKIDSGNNIVMMHEFDTQNGERCWCELRLSRRGADSFVAIVRDVTERVKRLEAETRVTAQALARQQDAQSINRFTRHEIKNGLLAGIELCDRLSQSYQLVTNQVKTTDQDPSQQRPQALSAETTTTEVNTNSGATTTLPSSTGALVPQAVRLESDMIKTAGMIGQVDQVLHEILDTVLAEAMARDVVYEIYTPTPKKVDLLTVLRSTGGGVGSEPRFPLSVQAPNSYRDRINNVMNNILNNDQATATDMSSTPIMVWLDAQLLHYIHRNAISNAIKYGKSNGIVSTNVYYDEDTQELKLEVVNEPGSGHDRLVKLGPEACAAVFRQSTRLHLDDDNYKPHPASSKFRTGSTASLSSGDGAWIMEKCAKNMAGSCSIEFKEDETVFTFSCKAAPVSTRSKGGKNNKNNQESETRFELPANTWGIGIDDSWVQRKLLFRIFDSAGIQQSRRKVLGRTISELDSIAPLIDTILDQDPDCKIFILVDEMLDYCSDDGCGRDLLSGSKIMREVLQNMDEQKQARVLALVRSANDSSEDVQIYTRRAHGFFSKLTRKREDILETLAPAWQARFGATKATFDLSQFPGDEFSNCGSSICSDAILCREDLQEVVASVDSLLEGQGGGKSFREVQWAHLWSALHAMKGDIMVSDQKHLVTAVGAINEMRGFNAAPDDFDQRWQSIRSNVTEGIKHVP